MKLVASLLMIGLAFSTVSAQQLPKPGPEHELLKGMEGNWDTVMKMMGQEFKGTCVYKLELNGFWLTCNLESEIFGMKFTGKGQDGYDQSKKKYVGTWIDSMTSQMLVFEGNYDKEKKQLVMTGDCINLEGKKVVMKSVTEIKDKDSFVFTMYEGDAKEPMFTVTYKRKK